MEELEKLRGVQGELSEEFLTYITENAKATMADEKTMWSDKYKPEEVSVWDMAVAYALQRTIESAKAQAKGKGNTVSISIEELFSVQIPKYCGSMLADEDTQDCMMEITLQEIIDNVMR